MKRKKTKQCFKVAHTSEKKTKQYFNAHTSTKEKHIFLEYFSNNSFLEPT